MEKTKQIENQENLDKAKFIDIRENLKEITEIQKAASKRLASEEYNILAIPPEVIPTLVYEFIKQLCSYVVEKRQEGIEINFLQLLDFGVSIEEDEDGKNVCIPYINPGQEFKLKSKSDDQTEEDDE